ncbi:MAG: type II secretion system F family protein [Holosporaceae bacterium]|jgi:tight adherence protein C|nr:type II secretion system F family protein [Holosporaceae bacterium]
MDFVLTFFLTFIIIYFAKPHIERLLISMKAKLKLIKKIRNVATGEGGGSEEYDDKESIGLSTQGPMFGANSLFNFLAEKNKELIEDMQNLLQKAGMRQQNALEEFMKSKLNSAIALFFLLFFLYILSEIEELPLGLVIITVLIISILGGHKLTDLNLEIIASKRKEAIENGVPDLVDLLVICSESGLDLNRSIRRIARELRTSNPTLADELSLTSIELEMIPDHRQVFQNLEDRTDCIEIKTLSKTLSQSIEYGTSLSVTLRDLAVESRQKRMLNAEAKAAQAPTLLTLPMMFFIMPCLFIVMLGPVIIGMMKSFNGGGGGAG